MHRFFVSSERLQSSQVTLDGSLAHQISRVLRLAPGDHVLLLDGTGLAYDTELTAVGPHRVVGAVVDSYRPQSETRHTITLCQALPKARKIEWILQKGTELGVSVFSPMSTRFMVPLPRNSDVGAKLDRWRRIVTEAAEQSGRTAVPQVLELEPFERLCIPAEPDELPLMLCLDERAQPLRRVLSDRLCEQVDRVHLFVGPEGGFSDEEVGMAQSVGLALVSLGPRTLRSETAPLVALSAILYELGELG